MEKHSVNFSESEAYPLAERLFLKACRFDLGKAGDRRLLELSRQVRRDGLAGVNLAGRWASLGPDAYDGRSLALAGAGKLRAAVFGRIDRAAVKRAYVYIVTAGECLCAAGGGMTEQLFAYMWGTAYVDAARLKLEGEIRARAMDEAGGGFRMSPSISPGFYGMDNRGSLVINKFLEGEAISIRCLDTGVMLPLKSCSGLFLCTDGSVEVPGAECATCIGDRTGCAQCAAGDSPPPPW
jgi:hypothetical protein